MRFKFGKSIAKIADFGSSVVVNTVKNVIEDPLSAIATMGAASTVAGVMDTVMPTPEEIAEDRTNMSQENPNLLTQDKLDKENERDFQSTGPGVRSENLSGTSPSLLNPKRKAPSLLG